MLHLSLYNRSVTSYSEKIEQKLATLPTKPGVYLMHNIKDQIIYVGKAINLANRVRSYFHASSQETPKRAAWWQRLSISSGSSRIPRSKR